MLNRERMGREPGLQLLVGTVVEAALKEVDLAAVKEVIENTDGLISRRDAQEMHAASGNGAAKEGAMKIEAATRGKSARFAAALPARLVEAAKLGKECFGGGGVWGDFSSDWTDQGIAVQSTPDLRPRIGREKIQIRNLETPDPAEINIEIGTKIG